MKGSPRSVPQGLAPVFHSMIGSLQLVTSSPSSKAFSPHFAVASRYRNGSGEYLQSGGWSRYPPLALHES